jgi:hypothetical protein
MRVFTLSLLIASVNLFAGEPELLKVMTLNVAHGRADGTNQLSQSTDEAKSISGKLLTS